MLYNSLTLSAQLLQLDGIARISFAQKMPNAILTTQLQQPLAIQHGAFHRDKENFKLLIFTRLAIVSDATELFEYAAGDELCANCECMTAFLRIPAPHNYSRFS